MAPVQSCIDNIGLWKKTASFSHCGFSLGLRGGWRGAPTDSVCGQKGSLGKGVGAWKILSHCCPKQEAQSWTK